VLLPVVAVEHSEGDERGRHGELRRQHVPRVLGDRQGQHGDEHAAHQVERAGRAGGDDVVVGRGEEPTRE